MEVGSIPLDYCGRNPGIVVRHLTYQVVGRSKRENAVLLWLTIEREPDIIVVAVCNVLLISTTVRTEDVQLPR